MNIGQTDTAQWAVLHKKRNNLKLHSGYFIVKSRYSKITQSKRKKIYFKSSKKNHELKKKKNSIYDFFFNLKHFYFLFLLDCVTLEYLLLTIK